MKYRKSSPQQLLSLGFIGDNVVMLPNNSKENIILQLKSLSPTERSTAANMLQHFADTETIAALIAALENEKKLYTKIEICNSLINIGEIAITSLIEKLGKIGNNQHKSIPLKVKQKKGYPIPLDIVARTIIRLKTKPLQVLMEVIENGTNSQKSEAIDAFGFICFYNRNENFWEYIKSKYLEYEHNDLLRWKTAIAFRSFASCKTFIPKIITSEPNQLIINELNYSLSINVV